MAVSVSASLAGGSERRAVHLQAGERRSADRAACLAGMFGSPLSARSLRRCRLRAQGAQRPQASRKIDDAEQGERRASLPPDLAPDELNVSAALAMLGNREWRDERLAVKLVEQPALIHELLVPLQGRP